MVCRGRGSHPGASRRSDVIPVRRAAFVLRAQYGGSSQQGRRVNRPVHTLSLTMLILAVWLLVAAGGITLSARDAHVGLAAAARRARACAIVKYPNNPDVPGMLVLRGTANGEHVRQATAAALHLRGGAEMAGNDDADGAADASELSPEMAELLADPQKRELAYNLTVAEFHKQRDKSGGDLSEETMEQYFWSHMLLRHPDVQTHEYNETHYEEFLLSFFGIEEEDEAHLEPLERLWAQEQARGAVGDIREASREDLVQMSSKYFVSSRRLLLHVPRDFAHMDQALAELADGGTLLVGPGAFVPSATLEHAQRQEGDEEGLCYVVESHRHALLIRGSFVERAGAANEPARGMRREDQGFMGDENEEGELEEVGPVKDVLTKAWGRWELGLASSGHIEHADLLLQAPAPQDLSSNHTRRAVVTVAGTWSLEHCQVRASLSVVITAVHEARLTVVACSIGGLGEAAGTETAAKYTSFEDLVARHSEMQAQAQALQESAEAWHKRMMWDKEMAQKLAELQDPDFLTTTPLADLDEAETLMLKCEEELVAKIPMMGKGFDAQNPEQRAAFEEEAERPDSAIWVQVAARAEDGVLVLDQAHATLTHCNITLLDVLDGAALRVGNDGSARLTACSLRDAAYAVSLMHGGSVDLARVVISNCTRAPLQAVEGSQAAGINMTDCYVACPLGRFGLWSGPEQPKRCRIDADNVFEEVPEMFMAQVMRGQAPDCEEHWEAMRQMDVEHKNDLEERLASLDVSQKVDEFEYSAPPGRRILFASDEFAAPV